MIHRLQTLQASSDSTAQEAIDLQAWNAATTLQFCGVELHTSQGRVSVSLRHHKSDGTQEEIAQLFCLQPGSSFSPPLDVAALARQGGQIQPVLLSASEDAVFDLYLGSNDEAWTPRAQVAVLMRARTPAEAQTAVQTLATFRRRYAELGLEQSCHLVLDLPEPEPRLRLLLQQQEGLRNDRPLLHQRQGPARSWLRRAVHAVAYGDLSDLGITHLVLQPDDAPLQPEGFLHALALARFLHHDSLFHGTGETAGIPGHWPRFCLDLTQVYRHGLPGADAALYAADLERQGLLRFGFPAPPAPLPAPGLRQQLKEQLARLSLPAPSTEIGCLKQTMTRQLRDVQRGQNSAVQRLENRLKDNRLWNPDRVHQDQDRANRTLLSLLRNRHPGARAVIVGNGPSLRTSDLDRLPGTVTFASNKIWLAYGQTAWRPTYYSVEDHLVLQNNRDRIEALEGSLKIFPANTRDFGYHAGDTIFAPFLPPRSFEDPMSDPEFPAFSHDLSHGIAWGSTIVYSQIQMALYMGCREVVLIGLDHTYQLPSEKHGNQYIHSGERNHFHPDYRAPGEAWHEPNLKVLETSYAKARTICDGAGIRIVNASRQTQLDVFDRADFDQLFPPQEFPA